MAYIESGHIEPNQKMERKKLKKSLWTRMQLRPWLHGASTSSTRLRKLDSGALT